MKGPPEKVYIVTAGEYSDYGIEKVFLDEGKANLWAERYNKVGGGFSDEARVEEYAISDTLEAVVSTLRMSAVIPPKNETWFGGEWAIPKEMKQNKEEGFAWAEEAKPIIRAYNHPDYDGNTTIFVEGCDYERVRKAFYDRVAKAKAEREGL